MIRNSCFNEITRRNRSDWEGNKENIMNTMRYYLKFYKIVATNDEEIICGLVNYIEEKVLKPVNYLIKINLKLSGYSIQDKKHLCFSLLIRSLHNNSTHAIYLDFDLLMSINNTIKFSSDYRHNGEAGIRRIHIVFKDGINYKELSKIINYKQLSRLIDTNKIQINSIIQNWPNI